MADGSLMKCFSSGVTDEAVLLSESLTETNTQTLCYDVL